MEKRHWYKSMCIVFWFLNKGSKFLFGPKLNRLEFENWTPLLLNVQNRQDGLVNFVLYIPLGVSVEYSIHSKRPPPRVFKYLNNWQHLNGKHFVPFEFHGVKTTDKSRIFYTYVYVCMCTTNSLFEKFNSIIRK